MYLSKSLYGREWKGSWPTLTRVCLYLGLGTMFGLVFYRDAFEHRYRMPRRVGMSVGHVTQVYGTVRHESWRSRDPAAGFFQNLKLRLAGALGLLQKDDQRLENWFEQDREIQIGDRLQTAENSAAEVLFFGGAILRLEPNSILQFEDDGNDMTLRLLLGRSTMELAIEDGPLRFRVKKANGKDVEISRKRRMILSLNSVRSMDEAVELQTVESSEPSGTLDAVELKALALGLEGVDGVPLLVPVLEDRESDLGSVEKWNQAVANNGPRIVPRYPVEDMTVDVDDEGAVFTWQPGGEDVAAYEVIVRPAFGYEVEDRARKRQVFMTEHNELPVEKVGGNGTFLWSVRAVTSKGQRGPASTPRWIVVRFPKQLVAPGIIKPKID